MCTALLLHHNHYLRPPRPAPVCHSPLLSCLLSSENFILSTRPSPSAPRQGKRSRIAFSAPEALRLSVHLTGQSRPSTASKYVFQDHLSYASCLQILYNVLKEKALFRASWSLHVIRCRTKPVPNDNASRLLGSPCAG